MAGTIAWKAPETFRGRYSPASDVFSLAVMDFELLTRQIPWAGVSHTEIIKQASEWFDEADRRVQRRLQRGESIEQQREEWLEDFPLEERRPDIRASAEAGCPAALIDLTQRCWADAPECRPRFAALGSMLGAVRAATARERDAAAHGRQRSASVTLYPPRPAVTETTAV